MRVQQLTGVNPKTLHFWDQIGLISPSVHQAHGTGSRRVYSFSDVVAVRIIADLRQAGIRPDALRKLVTYVRQMSELSSLQSSHPLATDGEDVWIPDPDSHSRLGAPEPRTWAIVVDLHEVVHALQQHDLSH